uniref:Uncharacterized protein n=1 Tax=Meloidogyne javanica TaxID=6303 RepID=A0A915N738_MELJA
MDEADKNKKEDEDSYERKKQALVQEKDERLANLDKYVEELTLDIMNDFKEKDEKLDAEYGKPKRARSPSEVGPSKDPVFEAEGPTEVQENEGGEEVQEDEGGPPKEKKGKFESA